MRPRLPQHQILATRAEGRASALYVVGSIVALLLVCLHWAQPPTAIAQIDLPPPYDPANMIRKCAFAWGAVHSYFGSVDNCFSWFPYSGVQLALESVLGVSYGQALIFALPVVASWLGAFACARAVGAVPAAAFLAGWVYAFNPARQIMFGLFATGEVFAAVLPWVLYWILVAAREPPKRRRATAALVTIAFAVLVVVALTPQLLVALIVGAAAVACYAAAGCADRRAFLVWAGKTAAWVVIASAWWVGPNALSYVGVAITHPVSPSSVAWTFTRASLLNELRFCAAWVWQYAEYNPWAVTFEHNAWLYGSGFVPVAGLITALAFCRGARLGAARFFGALALISLFVAKGVHPPLAQLNLGFYSLPGMFLFIEPYGAILIAAAGLSVCAALAADALLRSPSPWRSRVGVSFVAVSVAALFVNNVAPVTGAIFHEKTNFLPGVHFALPDEWIQAAAYLNRSGPPGGVAMLPPDDFYQADYAWGYHGVDVLPTELIHRDVLMPGAPWAYSQSTEAADLDAVLDRLLALRSPMAAEYLTDVGVRYVIVRNDVHPFGHGLAPAPEQYVSVFGGGPQKSFGALDIYDLGTAAPALARMQAASSSAGDAGDAQALRAYAALLGKAPASHDRESLLRALHPVSRVRTIALHALRSVGGATGTAIPALVGQSESSSTSIGYDVFNPSTAAMLADVRIGVWPRVKAKYLLTGGRGTFEATVDAAPVASWAIFRDVPLRPGFNRFRLVESGGVENSLAALLPPRFSPDQPWRPHVNEIEFAIVNPPVALPHAPMTAGQGIELDAPLSIEPALTLSGSESAGQVGWLFEFRYGGRPFTCFDRYTIGQEYLIADSVRTCLGAIGRDLTDGDASRIVVDRLILANRPPFDEQFATAAVSTEPATSIAGVRLVANTLTAPSARRVAWTLSGLGAVVKVDVGSNAPLVLSRTYSPTWIAIDATRWRILPHRRALGWRNAWDCPATGTVIVLNVLSALCIALLVIGFAIVSVFWVRK